jgi:hypothetical protein
VRGHWNKPRVSNGGPCTAADLQIVFSFVILQKQDSTVLHTVQSFMTVRD